jgi:hypothetical protein
MSECQTQTTITVSGCDPSCAHEDPGARSHEHRRERLVQRLVHRDHEGPHVTGSSPWTQTAQLYLGDQPRRHAHRESHTSKANKVWEVARFRCWSRASAARSRCTTTRYTEVGGASPPAVPSKRLTSSSRSSTAVSLT